MLATIDPPRSILLYHSLSLRLPIVDISHGWERLLACFDADETHVGAIAACNNGYTAHYDDDIDECGSHRICNEFLAAMQNTFVVGTTQDTFHKHEWPAKEHTVYLEN